VVTPNREATAEPQRHDSLCNVRAGSLEDFPRSRDPDAMRHPNSCLQNSGWRAGIGASENAKMRNRLEIEFPIGSSVHTKGMRKVVRSMVFWRSIVGGGLQHALSFRNFKSTFHRTGSVLRPSRQSDWKLRISAALCGPYSTFENPTPSY
jgi:hypothetical protein